MATGKAVALGIFGGVCVLLIGTGVGFGIGYAIFNGRCFSEQDLRADEQKGAELTTEAPETETEEHLETTGPPDVTTQYSFEFNMSWCELNCPWPKIPLLLEDVPYCPVAKQYSFPSPGIRRDPFAILTPDEMRKIHSAMNQHRLLTQNDRGPGLTDNFIIGMSLYPPTKMEVLRQFKSGSPGPDRYAEVLLYRGGQNQPDMMEYKVGPLHQTDMDVVAMTNEGELHVNSRPKGDVEKKAMEMVLKRELAVLKKLFNESFDGAYFPYGGLDYVFLGPVKKRTGDRLTKFVMAYTVWDTEHGSRFHVVPVGGVLQHSGNDVNAWKVIDMFYANQGPFSSPSDLMLNYTSGSVRRTSVPPGYRSKIDENELHSDNTQPKRPLSEKSPPRTFEPEGARYRINDSKVTWMGWEFSISVNQHHGPSVYRASFKGESVAYENSLSAINTFYSADPVSGTKAHLIDTTDAFTTFHDLIKGVDCPTHAQYLPVHWWDQSTQEPMTSHALCIFEADGQDALWRRKDSFLAGLRSNYLVVRSVLVSGHIDYTVDYHFLLDGKMKTKVSPTGYITTYSLVPETLDSHDPVKNSYFGVPISDLNRASVHAHTFSFKVDLDVLQTENTFQAIHWKAGDVITALRTQTNVNKKPSYFHYNETRYVVYEDLVKETGYRLDLKRQKFWLFLSPDHVNAWGVKRGYRMFPMATGTQVMTDSHPAMSDISYSKYHCVVARHHDNERSLASIYDMYGPLKSRTSLDDVLNSEDIENTDIVAWLSFSLLHTPTSEDVPWARGEETGFELKPFNFFDKTSVYDMPQYVKSYSNQDQRPPTGTRCVDKPRSDCYFCL